MATAYSAKNSEIKSVAKRYRYTGMERDEETGLNYHTARYYLPWLGRWGSTDPIGVDDGTNLYRYTFSNPLYFNDLNGKQSSPTQNVEEREISQHRNYFLSHTGEGELTYKREGAHNIAYVPGRGRGSTGRNSGVTIGVGIEIRHIGSRGGVERARFAQSLGANSNLTNWIMSVPNLGDINDRGQLAQSWLTANPSPTLTRRQVGITYTEERPDRLNMVRNRLTSSFVNAGARLTTQEFDNLDQRVKELLIDFAWNPGQIAFGRQHAFARALDVSSVNQGVVPYDAYFQLEQLRNFVANLPERTGDGRGHIQGRGGRRTRLGWIDARMDEMRQEVIQEKAKMNQQFFIREFIADVVANAKEFFKRAFTSWVETRTTRLKGTEPNGTYLSFGG